MMIPYRRSQLRRSFIRPKPREHDQPGGLYVFTYRGKDYALAGRFVNDPTSPDGQRWYASKTSARLIRSIVYGLADGKCELKISVHCWNWVSLVVGQAHHDILKKMGGSQHEDRIWVNGTRVRFWVCPECHREKHGKLHWMPKEKSE